MYRGGGSPLVSFWRSTAPAAKRKALVRGVSGIRGNKNWTKEKGGAKGVKCLLLKGGPSSWLVFLGEEVKGGNNMGEIRNKCLVGVGESQEGASALDRGRRFLVTNGSKFNGVHSNLSLTDDYAQKFHLGGIEEIFGEFK